MNTPPHPFTLLGFYRCYLTYDEVNEWSRMILNHPMYENYRLMVATRDCYKQMGDPIQTKYYEHRVLVLERELFEIAEAWCEEKRSSRHENTKSPAYPSSTSENDTRGKD